MITIDGIEISEIGLKDLRSKISIIPQVDLDLLYFLVPPERDLSDLFYREGQEAVILWN